MAGTTITPDQDAIFSEIDIAAPADRVFQGIGDAETVRRRHPEFDVFEMDLRVGGKWRPHLRKAKPYRGVDVIRHDGEVLEIDPPRLLVYTWFANFHSDPKHRSLVRWELTPTKSGTHVKMTHSELEAPQDYAGGTADGRGCSRKSRPLRRASGENRNDHNHRYPRSGCHRQ
jgi:uncharacterized protein YndB with AHSA1/START domain